MLRGHPDTPPEDRNMQIANLKQAVAELTEYWSPRVVGRVNDQYVKVAKLKGEFVWHQHEHEDELFLVLYGELVLQFEDGDVRLGPGDFHVVPRGKRHNPIAVEECGIALIEPVTTAHTGDVPTSRTRSIAEQLAG